MNKIYIVTAAHIGDEPTRRGESLIKRQRAYGWFRTLKRAEQVVVHNEGAIHEMGYYDHCVIEEVVSGLYPHVSREEWFKWVKDRYILVSKPKGLERSTNFGIG